MRLFLTVTDRSIIRKFWHWSLSDPVTNSVWTDDETDEWLQTVENGIVTGCSRTGGKGGWQLYSISRWTAEDGKRLKGHLEQEFEVKKNRQIYWDDVAMFCYPKEYQLGIRPMKAEIS